MDQSNSAEKILDKIFSIMQRLYNEMHLRGSGADNHLQVFDIFADLGRTLAGADRASFWRWDKEAHRLVTATATGTDQIVIDEKTGLVGKALAQNRPLAVNDPYSSPDFNPEVDKATGYKTKSVLVMPVSNCRGEVIGAFQAINKLTGEGFDETEDVRRLSIAAFICGMALESDLFLIDSQRDKLTGIKNRFGFYGDWQNKYLPLSNEIPLSFIICDIDFFKKVNDTYGHNGGDAVLVHVARLIKSHIRETDSVYRWGGEEFIIVLTARIDVAALAAERMRQAMEESVCVFEERNIKITMSFGAAEFNRALSVEENIKIADTRLYAAKENGRNRVVSE